MGTDWDLASFTCYSDQSHTGDYVLVIEQRARSQPAGMKAVTRLCEVPLLFSPEWLYVTWMSEYSPCSRGQIGHTRPGEAGRGVASGAWTLTWLLPVLGGPAAHRCQVANSRRSGREPTANEVGLGRVLCGCAGSGQLTSRSGPGVSIHDRPSME